MLLDRALMYLGRTLVAGGLLVFAFIAYQLYGTNFQEARQQDRLQEEAAELFEQAPVTTAAPSTTTPPGKMAPPTTPPPTLPPVPPGSAVAVMRIPKIDVVKAVVAGTSVNDLKKGPGHYTGTPMPGQPGNAAIAGHRTTYGAPFARLDELRTGDAIDVVTRQGTFVYKVTSKRIVSPDENSVLGPTKDNRLTLTTCHPRYSAAQRLIVVAELAPGEVPAAAPPTTSTTPQRAPTATIPGEIPAAAPTTIPFDARLDARLDGAGLSGQEVPKSPVILWGFLTLLVAICVYVLAKVWHRILAYAVGTPIFLVALLIFFENINRLLPANA